MARVAKVDTIERSKLSLNKCMVQSNNTVSVVTNAIESLQTTIYLCSRGKTGKINDAPELCSRFAATR